ncbi:hypothetical protein BV898_06629 [Hypsibius exemplaris]|uniref:U4/U6.U5 small nuclear ribonucleoprotein 27 kDa protein n=1 Tax=Hypsibius exemplaris TaxID=2072580 RepID=A0A1W0WW24_HYPEX|nr:hypothetical protein BV898_06629 [Hypsibius exemplaris]
MPPGDRDRDRIRDRERSDRDGGSGRRPLKRDSTFDDELERMERDRKRARRSSRSRSVEKTSRSSPDRKRRRSPDRSDGRLLDREKLYRNRSRTRSASRERIRERDRERDRIDEKTKMNKPEKKAVVAAPFLSTAGMDDEDMMASLMGFASFDSSKGKKVEGNDVGSTNVAVKRKYRQYMNRRGGFNRPLDPVV